MNKTAYTIIIAALIVAIGVIFTGGGPKESAQSVEIRDGVQYITVEAGGGYSPAVTEAKGGLPTKLIMKTNGTFDCSAALVIRSVGFQQILPQSGETVIDLGVPKQGEPIRGTCSMGMYNFVINFS